MGVGDYVHSRDAPQAHQSRQFLAEQAKVDIPTTKFAAPTPRMANGTYNGGPSFPDQQREPYDDPTQGDMFDTDVEGVDESTAAGTTIYDPDETQQFNIPPSRQYNHENRPNRQLRQAPRQYETNWYENLGDRAMKTAGFDSDDADVDDGEGSQMASSLDEEPSEANGWHYRQNQRAGEEPLSKRLENFWNASNKANPKSSIPQPSHPAVPSSAPDARRGQMAPNGGRKVTLPRSRTGTPTTRFNPKSQLVEQRDPSPTRRASIPRAQPTREKNMPVAFPVDEVDDGSVFTTETQRPTNGHPGTIFDITNLDILDDEDATIRNPFTKTAPSNITEADPFKPKKRHLEPDYPPEILYQKSFTDLQSEPFDYAPTPTASPTSATAQPDKPQPDTEDKITLLLRLPEQDRNSYLSILSIEDWEDCGDQLLDRFSQILSKMKDLRHARRKTAGIFEAEVARRHGLVEEQSVELSEKLNNMRTGGAEVLRGRSPF